MGVAHLVASSFTLYKNRPVVKLIVRHLSEEMSFFEIVKIVLQIAELMFPHVSCVLSDCLHISRFECSYFTNL